MKKTCTKCHESQDISDFQIDKRRKDALNPNCRNCTRANALRWARKNKEKLRRSFMKRHYGIGPEDYDAMLKKQNGGCAICLTDAAKEYRRLDIDHNHLTGQIRGLLCVKCNKGIGLFQDDIDLLINAAKYLAHYKT